LIVRVMWVTSNSHQNVPSGERSEPPREKKREEQKIGDEAQRPVRAQKGPFRGEFMREDMSGKGGKEKTC